MTTPSWHLAALYDLENTSMTRVEIGKRYNRSPETIKKLQERHNVVRKHPPQQKGPTRRENNQPISRQHHTIGIRLSMARGGAGAVAFAEKIGVSPIILAKMEVGQYDFTLSQLFAISEATKMSLQQLMQSFDNNLYQPRRSDVSN